MPVPSLKLNDGNRIPQLGLGLWQVSDETQFNTAFKTAVKSGYRLFDSAQYYRNEKMLGDCVRASKLKREDFYITTKIAVNNFGYKKTLSSFDESLEKLGMDYVDLILLHFPVSILRKKSWLALQEIKQSGRAKSIGVSNYTIRHLEELKTYADVLPAVNQVELHVFLQQPELVDYCQANDILIEAYSPLAHGQAMDNDLIIKLAKKYSMTYAQIMLRFLTQLGLVVIPKSVTAERIEQNFNIFDFKIDKKDMEELKSLNRNLRTCWNPTHVP